jgi:galactokinase
MGRDGSRTVRWRSPGRVNLIGEHTDYNDGFCMPLAIGMGCSAAVTARPDGGYAARSAQRPGEVSRMTLRPLELSGDDQWAGYALGVVWSLLQRGHSVPGVDIEVDSDVPTGAGLSSSAALECSVAAALNDYAALGLSAADLVAVSRHCENEFVGAPTGGMDQLASVFGQAEHVLLCDMRSLAVEALPFDLTSAGLSLLIVDSKAPHQLTDGLYGQRRNSCEEAARRLGVRALRDVSVAELDSALELLADPILIRRARHVITENARTLECAELLRTGRTTEIGPLLVASHQSLRDDFEVSVPEVDLAVETLLSVGALGARITGGGFGGCAIALISQALVETARTEVDAAFAAADYRAPESFVAHAAQGTHRLD